MVPVVSPFQERMLLAAAEVQHPVQVALKKQPNKPPAVAEVAT